MKLLPDSFRRGTYLVMLLLLSICTTRPAFAQEKKEKQEKKKKNFFDQISDKVDNVTESIKSNKESAERLRDRLDNLSDMGLLSKEEFARQVTVVKGEKGDKFIYPDGVEESNVTHLQYGTNGFSNMEWKPVSFFEKQLFPSAIIGMANYRDSLKGKMSVICQPLGFSIRSTKENVPFRWEIECEGNKYFPKLKGNGFYTKANSILAVMPEIAWSYTVLSRQIASTPVSVVYRIIDEKGHKDEKTVTLQMRSINDCIYQYTDLNLDFLFIAYIQEEHPEIDNILRDALNTKMVPSFNEGTEEETNMQVAAVWRVLHDRDFRYSDIARPVARSDSFSSQSVRPFAKAIKTNQGNCVDGTVVMASVLKKIGISTIMVFTSEHCFLGYRPVRGQKKTTYVETTLLSNADFLNNAKTPAEKNEAYRKQFDAAVEVATKEYTDSKQKGDVHRVGVDEMRNLVQPIPFASK